MNQMNMPGMNGGNPGMGGMPLANNMPNGTLPKQGLDQDSQEADAKLNSWIYGYFLQKEQWDLARSLKSSGLAFSPALTNSEDEMNGVNEDSKNDKKPADLPNAKSALDDNGNSLLQGWFALFWDMFSAQRRKHDASKNATEYIAQNKMQRQSREQMYRTMAGMAPNQMNQDMQQIMRMNPDLRQRAMQNQQNGTYRGMNPQMQMALQQQQQQQRNAMMQQNMRRDPSGMDMNGQRPRTPSSGDHAPSPKRPRMDVAGLNPQQMLQNGRPPGMPPQMMQESTQQANALLMSSGINPANLSEAQFASFQQQQPQREGMSKAGSVSNGDSSMMPDPMTMATAGPEYYGAPNPNMMRAAMPPNPGAANGNHALQDYQMQLMLLEQQNKKRLLMARQEQDGPGQPGIPGPMGPISPGSRGGPSPGPGGERRGTPKLGQSMGDGSPMPDGSMRGSPGMNTFAMQPEMYPQMTPGVRPPPSSNPAFNAQFNPQQMEQMRANGQMRMPNGAWQPGVPTAVPMGQPAPNQQQQQAMGTPQPRNDMPPPQAPPPGAANGRTGSDDQPPTPQPTSKPNPKKKESKKKTEGKPKKNSTSVAQTPASEADNPPPTPTPATPNTPSHPNSFNTKTEAPQAGATQNANTATAAPVAAPHTDANTAAQFGSNNVEGMDADNNYAGMTGDMTESSLLDNFDFEQFLDNSAFQYDPSSMDLGDMMDAGAIPDPA